MRRVAREDIVDRDAYEHERQALRGRMMEIKRVRRVHLGAHLTFLFENRDTIRYQIQEMLRVEGRTAEEDVLHELETYNELLGGEGELGCTLMIEIEDALQRDIVLRKWIDLPRHVYARLADGRRVRAQFDPRQLGDSRLSSVQYLRFACEGQVPVALGLDLEGVDDEVELDEAVRAALAADLAG